jgi:hypothetical protein
VPSAKTAPEELRSASEALRKQPVLPAKTVWKNDQVLHEVSRDEALLNQFC